MLERAIMEGSKAGCRAKEGVYYLQFSLEYRFIFAFASRAAQGWAEGPEACAAGTVFVRPTGLGVTTRGKQFVRAQIAAKITRRITLHIYK
jgi:hypothetical protein